MTTKIELTPELERSILAAIRAGGFPHVAAAAFGVPSRLFKKWLRRGVRHKNSVYASFARNVCQAQATARLAAEMKTHDKDPRLWLRSGPGRETPEAVGWTTFVRPRVRPLRRLNLFASPDFLQLLASLRAALATHPEALEAVNRVLATTG